MLHAGLDLSGKKVDVCLLSEAGEHLDQLATPPDADSLRRLARRIEEVHREPVCAVVESMTGTRLVHRRSGCPIPGEGGAQARPLSPPFGEHKSALKNRVHSTLINFCRACPVTDPFGAGPRAGGSSSASDHPYIPLDQLDPRGDVNRRLKEGHASTQLIPGALSRSPSPGGRTVFTIAAEIGEIERFASPEKLTATLGFLPPGSTSRARPTGAGP